MAATLARAALGLSSTSADQGPSRRMRAQNKAVRTIKARHQILLPAQQSGQHEHAAGRERARDLRRQERQRSGEDVGEDQIVGRACCECGIDQAVGGDARGRAAPRRWLPRFRARPPRRPDRCRWRCTRRFHNFAAPMARSPVPQPISSDVAIAPALGEIAQDAKGTMPSFRDGRCRRRGPLRCACGITPCGTRPLSCAP